MKFGFFVVSFVMDGDGNGRHNKFSINLHLDGDEKIVLSRILFLFYFRKMKN